MRASPSVRLAVAASARWRIAVSFWAALLTSVLMYWASESTALTGPWIWPFAVAAAAVGAGVAWQMLRLPPRVLAWDGQSWRCARAAMEIDEAPPGALQVCLDFGGWMLVRHRAQGARSSTWVPVQRASDDPSWHLFRCAVYSARPEVGSPPHDSTPGAPRRGDSAA